MRVTIIAIGSRGDVQPYIALGVGFLAAGHTVYLATHEEFAPMAREYGMEWFPIGINPREMLESEAGYAMLASDKNPFRFVQKLAELAEPSIVEFVKSTGRACEGAEAVVLSNLGMLCGFEALERLQVPYCGAFLQPSTPTGAVASVFFPDYPKWLPFGRRVYNRLTHYAFSYLLWICFGRLINRLQVGRDAAPQSFLDALRREQWRTHPIYYGYSPSVIPQPDDWPARFQVTGYWFLDAVAEYQPPAELLDFLSAGPPPVYVGFGSMRNRDPEAVTAIVVEALQRTGQRGMLNIGWGGLQKGEMPDNIFLIESAPHDWLFPRMAAVVHHGGAGTTAAGLRAGVPSILVPFCADQPYWGRRVVALGVGPRPIARKHLTAKRLEEAIRIAVSDQQMHARAAALGERLRAENGVATMVHSFEEFFETTTK